MMKAFFRDASGATAIEHALVVAFAALAMLGVLALCGARLYGVFTEAAEILLRGGAGTTQQ